MPETVQVVSVTISGRTDEERIAYARAMLSMALRMAIRRGVTLDVTSDEIEAPDAR